MALRVANSYSFWMAFYRSGHQEGAWPRQGYAGASISTISTENAVSVPPNLPVTLERNLASITYFSIFLVSGPVGCLESQEQLK